STWLRSTPTISSGLRSRRQSNGSTPTIGRARINRTARKSRRTSSPSKSATPTQSSQPSRESFTWRRLATRTTLAIHQTSRPKASIRASGQIIPSAANISFSPVTLDAQNTYYGLYANETFHVTNRLSLTAGGRYNLAKIVMADLLGTSPDINGNFTFSRFNPV